MPINLVGAASAWAAARQRGVAPKTFADLLSIEPELGSYIDDARAVGHDDQTILDHLDGALPDKVNARGRARAQLSSIDGLPEDQRSFARFDTRDDYGPLGLPARDVDRLDDRDADRPANVGEYERMDRVDNPLLMEIASADNQRLKRQHIEEKGFWPADPDTGRPYVVAHKQAYADLGEHVLSNIEALPADVHDARHAANNDPARFSQRGKIAQGYGGRVLRPGESPGKVTEPKGPITPRSTLTGPPRRSVAPKVLGPNGEVLVPGPIIRWTGDLHPSGGGAPGKVGPRGAEMRALGWMSVVPAITGVLSGRIRTDNLDNFASDLMGYENQQDEWHRHEEARKRYMPNSKPGDLVI